MDKNFTLDDAADWVLERSPGGAAQAIAILELQLQRLPPTPHLNDLEKLIALLRLRQGAVKSTILH